MIEYQNTDEETKNCARQQYRVAFDSSLTNAEIDHEIIEGSLYCPHCNAWDCDMCCVD